MMSEVHVILDISNDVHYLINPSDGKIWLYIRIDHSLDHSLGTLSLTTLENRKCGKGTLQSYTHYRGYLSYLVMQTREQQQFKIPNMYNVGPTLTGKWYTFGWTSDCSQPMRNGLDLSAKVMSHGSIPRAWYPWYYSTSGPHTTISITICDINLWSRYYLV